MNRVLRLALLSLPIMVGGCTDDTSTTSTTDTGAPTDSGVTGTVEDFEITEVEAEVDGVITTLIHVSWTLSHDAKTWVTFHTGDEDWRDGPQVEASAGKHETIIVGVTPETEVTWKAMAQLSGTTVASDEQITTTGALPSDFPEFLLAENDPTGWDHPYILGTVSTDEINQWVLFMLNRDGEVVWYWYLEEGFWAPYVKLSLDGRSILFNARDSPNDDRRIYRMGIDGELHEEWVVDGMSHAFAELEDGTIVYPREVGLDEEVTAVHTDGTTEVIWSCSQWFQETGNPNLPCYHNGLNWYPDRGTFLISFYNLNTIAEVDIDSGATLRSFGDVNTSYDFDDPKIHFDFQHHPTWTSRGYLMTTTSDPPGETWAREFEVDAANETLIEKWNYGEGQGLQASTIGEATRLDNDNTLINWGSTPHIREVKLDGTIVWDGFLSKSRFMGRIQPVMDPFEYYCPGCYDE